VLLTGLAYVVHRNTQKSHDAEDESGEGGES